MRKQFKRYLHQVRVKAFGLEYQFRGMVRPEIYDSIYRKTPWGRDKEGNPTSGPGSHTDRIIQPYIAKVKEMLKTNEIKRIVDLGCGDFNVGKNFVEDCEHYIACDISQFILDANRKKFNFSTVDFVNLDIVEDPLPRGDIAFVRQVLQHLSNEDILKFVEKIKATMPYKFLLVTEHLPSTSGFVANLNKRTGADIRLHIDSGVELHKKPFNLPVQSTKVLVEVAEPLDQFPSSVIRSTLYELTLP